MTTSTTTTSTDPGSLHGLTVLELSTSVAGPMCGQILGDLGAEIIKIERVGHGDDTRSWAPPVWNGVSTAFLQLNRNKRSIELNYKDPRGAAVLERLVERADILVQNLRPGALDRAGFGWERLHELNSRLIYVEMTGFGSVGPKADEPAYDPLLQAYSGIVSMMPETGSGPSRVPLSILDKGTGMWAVIGTLEALRKRDRDGIGSKVDVSLLATALEWVAGTVTNAMAGNKRENLGSGFPGVVPYGAFPTADGHVFIAAGNQRLWVHLLTVLEAPELNMRDGFDSNAGRSAHRAEVISAISELTRQHRRDDLVTRLRDGGVPTAPVRHADELIDDPQVAAIGGLSPLPHPDVPDLHVVTLPVRFDQETLPQQSPPPLLGADTGGLLKSLGYDTDTIETLVSAGVAAQTGERTPVLP